MDGSEVHDCSLELFLSSSPPPLSSTLAAIDQTEFEGFEYINPLLMSKVDDV